MKILLAGCGDIGKRTAMQLAGHQCFGLRRQPDELPSSIQPIAGDITNTDQLVGILDQQFDVVIVTLTPDSFTEQAYRESYLAGAKALASAMDLVSSRPKLVLWVSSTSVYGNNQGKWVDESSPTLPESFSGKVLLEAEQVIRALPCCYSIVRFSGIYGPGRERLLSQVRAGKGRPAEPQQWSNRIHADDCAGILAHLIDHFADGLGLDPVYIGSDCSPVTQHDLRNWMAAQLGVTVEDEIVAQKSIRRCSNQRLLQAGYKFIYPSYKEGYLSLIHAQ
ncbi:MAG: SDR family oxidoreductase [Porticoccaceae bacterium]